MWINKAYNRLVNRIVKRGYNRAVFDYGKKLGSAEITNEKEQETCHLAKLTLYSDKDYHDEHRVNSLKSLAEVESNLIIPYILREISLLTKSRPDESCRQLLISLYILLRQNKNNFDSE